MAVENWDFDLVRSRITFRVPHMMTSVVRGCFHKWTGGLEIDSEDLSRSRVEVQIDSASIDTLEDVRDAHLRSAEFLDAESYPHIVFRSTDVAPTADRRVLVTGDLTIRGMTRQVALDVQFAGRPDGPPDRELSGFKIRATIRLRHFDLNWNQLLETGGLLIGEAVEIDLDIHLTKTKLA